MIKNIAVGVILVIVGYAYGRYVQPARVETKIVTQIQTVEKKNVVITQTETIKPDGTKTVTTITRDKSIDSSQELTKSDTVKDNRAQWKFTVQLAPQHPELYYFYGAEVDRRILGPIFVGGYFNIDKTVGISLGLEM